MLQNIAIPKNIIFMDEPWSNLDRKSIELCKEVINQNFPNKTIIVVDHGESGKLTEFYKARIHIENCSSIYQENESYSMFKEGRAEVSGEANSSFNLD